MPQKLCPSCCSLCTPEPAVSLTSNSLNPLAFSNLLPAGTLQIPLLSDRFCSHTHAEDGWHPFTPSMVNAAGADHESSLPEIDLDFLVKHRFVCATCQRSSDGTSLVIRIYLIPHDLANFEGKLRNRDEIQVMTPARKYLKALLPRIIQDALAWNGHSSAKPSGSRPFLSQAVVCNFTALQYALLNELLLG
jgi:hypothetical protein